MQQESKEMQSSLWLWAGNWTTEKKTGSQSEETVKKPQELVRDEGGLIITITAMMIWKRKAAHAGL